MKDKKGSSKVAILRYITSNYNVGDEEKKVHWISKQYSLKSNNEKLKSSNSPFSAYFFQLFDHYPEMQDYSESDAGTIAVCAAIIVTCDC